MITVITSTIRPERMDDIFRNYEHQAIKEKELIIILNRDDMDLAAWQSKASQYPNVSVYQLSSKKTVGQCKNFAVRKAKYKYIAKFDDDDYYGPYYLTELMRAFRRKKADIVGKAQYFAYVEKYNSLLLREGGPENRFVKELRGPTIAFHKKVFKKVRWPKRRRGGDKAFQKRCVKRGFKLYSTSKYNFTYIRRKDQRHTWRIADKRFMKDCKFIKKTYYYKRRVNKTIR